MIYLSSCVLLFVLCLFILCGDLTAVREVDDVCVILYHTIAMYVNYKSIVCAFNAISVYIRLTYSTLCSLNHCTDLVC